MNGAHLHLVLTHLPVLGVAFGTLLLGFGLLRGNRVVQQTALGILVLAGITAGAAYLTGEAAEEAIEGTLGSGKSFLERHEDASVAGLIAAGIAGGMALIALVTTRKGRSLSRGLALVNLLLALGASGILAWVANLGGQIGHPEIRSGQVTTGDREEAGDEAH